MYSVTKSFGLNGLRGFAVAVEADVSGGLPAFSIVGLPDSAVRESADRVRAAIKNLGFKFPDRRITVNLAPADVRKTGPVYDLPLLLAVLTASWRMYRRTPPFWVSWRWTAPCARYPACCPWHWPPPKTASAPCMCPPKTPPRLPRPVPTAWPSTPPTRHAKL